MPQNFSLLYPPDYDSSKEVRMKDFEFVHALQIDDMIILPQGSYRGYSDLVLEKFFSTDPKVLDYRLAIFEDLINNPGLYKVLCDSIPVIFNISDLKRALTVDFSVESALSSVRYLEMYQQIVNLFSDAIRDCEVHSEGMKRFRELIIGIADSEEYQSLDSELSKMEINFGHIKSVTIGINLDENLQVTEAGLLSANTRHFHAGSIIDRLLRKKSNDEYTLMSSFYPMTRGLHGEDLKTFNASLRSSLSTVFAKSLRDFEPLLQNYYKINTSLFVSLLDDIRFLTAGTAFIMKITEKGFTMCRPRIAAMEEKVCELEQVYNPMLVFWNVEQKVVANSYQQDENGRFYIVTGPNHGGKSIFAKSIGMAQALFQLGIFVPAERAYMSPVSGIYTHFPESDENNYGKGRLESECTRLGGILKELSDTDMLLMDESFSSTSSLEADYIASEVLTGLGVIGCCGFFVTHIHGLSVKVDQFNSHPENRGKIDNLIAVMEDKEAGVRSYRISRTMPDGLSYAKDIAIRYGLGLDEILRDRKK